MTGFPSSVEVIITDLVVSNVIGMEPIMIWMGEKPWGYTHMWRLVWGNVLGFLEMFKDSHVWLQITPGNQMLEESGFHL